MMARPLKIALAVAGGLLALLLGGVAYLVATFDPNDYKPLVIETVQKERQRTLAIPGPISLTFLPRLGVTLGEVTLSERNSAERFASIRSAEVSLALWPLLRREAVVDRVSLDGLRLRVVRTADGRLSIDDLLGGDKKVAPAPAPAGSAASAPGTAPLRLDIAGIAITDAEITVDDRQAPRRLKLSQLSLETGRIAPGTATSLSLKARLDADAPKLGADVSMKARLTLGPAEAIASRVLLEGLALDVAARLDGLAPMKLHVEGRAEADLAAGKLDSALTGTFDDSRFKLTLAAPRLSPAAWRFDAEIDRLDLDRLLASRGPASAASAPAGAEQPLDLSALRGLDASGQLRIGALQVMNLKASAVRAGLRAGGGRVQITPLAAELYQGKLAGSITVNAATTPARIAAQPALTGIAIGPLLKDMTGQDRLQGRGDVALDVTTAGTTISAMTRALAGSARVQLRDGAVRGINVAQAVRRARTAIQAVRGKGSADGSQGSGTATAAESTDFTELTASFRITAGVARNDDLALKSPLMRIGGSGDIDLAARRLDYTVRATIVDTLQGQGGADLEALRGQTVPVKLTGPFDAIDWKIDVGAMVKDAAQGKVEQQIERKRDQLEEEAKRRLGDKLRGLLGK